MSFERLIGEAAPLAMIEVSRVEGSAPREPGAFMLVTMTRSAGTIGGGRLEWEAVAAAREMLAGEPTTSVLTFPLGPELGQCCGGRVTLTLRHLDTAERAALLVRLEGARAAQPAVYIFGAGHTGMALARALVPLPVAVTLVDTREALLASAPAGVATILTALPESVVRGAPARSGFAIMTHDHALDFLIAHEAIDRGDAAYVGLIGSASKRARFEGERARRGLGRAQALTCPIGAAGLGDKRPAVIAVHTAAEIMAAFLMVGAARPEAPAGGGVRQEGLAWIR